MASRRSITPRAIPVKCDSTPSEAAIAPRRGGRPTTRGSYPTKISTKITAAATMKAVIWLRVTLDAHTPTAASPATRRAAPKYCAIRTPTSSFAPSARPSGIVSVSASAVSRNSTWPAYFPTSSSSSVTGCASRMYAVGWSNNALSSRRAMVRIAFISRLGCALGELLEQVLQAPRGLVQLVQRPAARFGEREDLGPEVPRPVGRERERDAPVRGAILGRDLADARQLGERRRHTVPRRLDGDLDRPLGLADQPVYGPVGHDPAAADDEQPGARVLHLGEHVGGEDHRTGLAELGDQAPDLDALVRIESFGGLVEHEQVGAVQDGLREPDSLAEALGQLADGPVVDGLEAGPGDGVVDGLAAGGPPELPPIRDEREVFRHHHVT